MSGVRAFCQALFLLVLTAASVSNVCATSIHDAVKRDFGEERLSVWAETTGDLNGDGLSDAAVVLKGGAKELFVIYAGNDENSFSLVSRSAQFCQARQFYNLHIRNGSIYVEAVHSVGDPMTSTSLEFRYDRSAKDFRLIGEEYEQESAQVDDTFRGRVDYITGNAIYSRRNELGSKAVSAIFSIPPQFLNEFDCSSWRGRSQNVYIGEDLEVSR